MNDPMPHPNDPMPHPKLTLENLREADAYIGQQKKSASETCDTYLLVLPLRYAIVCGTDKGALQTLAPALPGHLGKRLVKPIQTAHYAIRFIREGFLYILVRRSDYWAYEGVFHSDNSGNLEARFPLEVSKNPNKINLRSIAIELLALKNPHLIEEARIFFVPDPLTPRMMEAIRKNEGGLRDRLQSFDIAALAKNAKGAEDVLSREDIPKYLAEQIAFAHDQRNRNKMLSTVLEQQLFSGEVNANINSASASFAQMEAFLRYSAQQSGPEGFAVVLDDAIGITQALNNWRNAGIEDTLRPWLNRETNDQGILVSNERKLIVAHTFKKVREEFETRSAANMLDNELAILDAQLNNPEMRAGRNFEFTMGDWWDRVRGVPPKRGEKEWNEASGDYRREKEKGLRASIQKDLQKGVFKERFEKTHIDTGLIDLVAMQNHMDAFDAKCREAEVLQERRGNDHQVWVTSERLVAAFDVYDDDNLENGWQFSGQSGLCVIGAEGHKATAEFLKKWWCGSAKDAKNLALRGFALNQKEIKAEMDRILASANPGSRVPASESQFLGTTLSITQKLADLYDKANEVYEEMGTNSQIRLTDGALAWYASLGTQLLRYPPNGAEGWMFQRITRLFSGAIARRAIELRLEEVARTRTEAYFRTQIEKSIREKYINARSSEFYRVRAGAALLFLEGMFLMLRASQLSDGEQSDDRYLLFIGHALLVISAGIELAAALTNIVTRRFGERSVTHTGAQHFFGQLKLWGGGLGAAGGIVLAWQDWEDTVKTFKEERLVLSGAYFVRFGASIGMSIGQLSLGIIAARPMFEKNVQRGANLLTRSLLGLSTKLAPHAATISLWMLRGFWVITTISVIIWIFSDNAMQAWCKKSVFRGGKYKGTEMPEKEAETEIAKLYAALKGIL
jgi:hypothetical protein